jgi:asparagine synthase (glutamine-hydrolysing)
MCGIAGFWGAAMAADDGHETVRAMADAVTHRGPDSAGTWVDAPAGLALGHRRLAILDLSPAGHQPMASPSGRYVVAFNGEVYNFRELRRELEARFAFNGDSDTEVMLAAVEAWGLQGAVRRFVGMFAFALWDRAERTLHLVRDRLGVKPLYYGWAGDALVFGSELKALRAHPGFAPEVDRGAVSLLLRHTCIPAPYTIYRAARKLLPGTVLTLRAPGDRSVPVPFWSAAPVAEDGAANPFRGTPEEAVEQLDVLLRDAVGLRMISDVPLGAFLSGGVDSSAVVALMQAQSARPVRTFSIGNPDGEYDEAGDARAVARHLGTDHTELYATADDARAVIPLLPRMFDEPFADSSQIPTYLVSALARRQVTVSLSGDGGDELFAGYNRHLWGRRVGRVVQAVPARARRVAARGLTALSPDRWNRAYRMLAPILPATLRQRIPGDKLHKVAAALTVDTPDELYLRLVSQWTDPAAVVVGGTEPPTRLAGGAPPPALTDFTLRMMFCDLVTYLPDDILTKVDRASMAVGLEARVPLLDHRVVEFASSLPLELKVRAGQTKWALRQVLYRYVPPALVERPKMGFGVPLDAWLRGPLRPWAEGLLDPDRLRREGFFRPEPVRHAWSEHVSGRRNRHHELWDVLMFQAWLQEHGARVPEAELEAA